MFVFMLVPENNEPVTW